MTSPGAGSYAGDAGPGCTTSSAPRGDTRDSRPRRGSVWRGVPRGVARDVTHDVWRGRWLAALVVVLLGALTGGSAAYSVGTGAARLPASAASLTPAETSAEEHEVTVHLGGVEPAVLVPRQKFMIHGTVRNAGETATEPLKVSARYALNTLATREEVVAWAEGEQRLTDPIHLGSVDLDPVPPGGTVSFQIEVGPEQLISPTGLTSLPMTLSVSGSRHTPHSFLVVNDGATDPVPVRTAWLAPLVLPGDARLFAGGSPRRDETRVREWAELIGPDGQFTRLLEDTRGVPVSWAVDPTLVVPGALGVPAPVPETDPGVEPLPEPTPTQQTPTASTPPPSAVAPTQTLAPSGSATANGTADVTGAPAGFFQPGATGTPPPSPSASASPTDDPNEPEPGPEGDDPIAELSADFAAELLQDHRTVVTLPAADVDLTSALRTDPSGDVVAGLVRGTPGAAPDAQDILWPLGAPSGDDSLTSLHRAWADLDRDRVGTVVPSSSLVTDDPLTSTAVRRSADGDILLVHDPALSTLLGRGRAPDSGQVAQRYLADTLAIYHERPQVARSLLAALPRGSVVDPTVLQTVASAQDQASWLESTPVTVLPQTLAPDSAPVHVGRVAGQPGDSSGDGWTPAVAPSPVPERYPAIAERQLNDLSIARSITSEAKVPVHWDEMPRQLWSNRWRGKERIWRTMSWGLSQAGREVLSGITVQSTDINFLATSGPIRVTVTNSLDVPVHDLELSLASTSAVLRLADSAKTVTIQPNSRASVQFTAHAASQGKVELIARLHDPQGRQVGSEVPLHLRVRPLDEFYWVLGILTAVIFAAGVARTIRKDRAARAAEGGGSGD